MAESTESCCGPLGRGPGCRIESIVSLDERGQMVLPKDLRQRAGINPGDKLAVVSWQNGEEICCISLVKADNFADTLKTLLGPMMKELTTD